MFSKLKPTIYILTFLLGLTLASSASAAITIRPMLNTGLVGYWSMDEGAGTTANDQSGYRNNGTLTQMDPATDWVDGKLGKALDFDGINDRIVIPTQTLGTFSFSAWINTLSTSDYAGIFTGSDIAAGIYITPDSFGADAFKMNFYDDYDNHLSNTQISNNVWHHIAVTVNAGLVTFYLDGNTDGTATGAPAFSYNNIGYNSYSSSFPFSGKIDEFRLYNRALSSGEVTRLYNLTRTKFKAASSQGLVGYWAMDEGSGTIVGDMSGAGNNGIFAVGDDPPSWTTGKRGGAVQFTGSGYIPDDPWIDLGTSFNVSLPFSISAWINPTDYDSYPTIISKRDSWTSNNMRFHLMINSDGGQEGQVRFNGNPASTRLFDYIPALNTWTQVTVIAQAASTDLYINGAFMQGLSGVTLGTDNTARVGIGRNGETNDTDPFHGKIDEVRVYNRALSATEVANLYGASKKIFKVSASQNNKLTDGLVGLWSFNGPDISGSLALDRSGNGNNGTISGASVAIGKVGQALKFDGSTNQYVDVGSSNSYFATTSPTTISAWIYPKSIGGGSSGRIIHRRGTADVNGGDFQLTATNALLFGFDGTTALRRTSSNNVVNLNSWQHVLATWDGSLTASNIHLYVNSVETSYQTTQNGSGIYETNNQSTRIGNRHDGGRTFDGTLDEVRIYNRALSAAEIKRLYNLGK